MKKGIWYLVALLPVLVFTGCNNDDDNGIMVIPPRERAEEAPESEALVSDYLATHFYNYEEFENPPADFDFKIKFDTIAGDNIDKIPLAAQVETSTLTISDVDYNLRVLKVRPGVGEVASTFADSTLITFSGNIFYGERFDSAATPINLDLANTIPGFSNGFSSFRGGSGFMENPDGTVTFNNDYGVGAVFIPSGLAYYASPPSGIGLYDSLIFTFNVFRVNTADHDNDGIPSFMEDLDGDRILLGDADDNTDGDRAPNYLDPDDDNDGTPTREEIEIDEDGNITFPDSDGDGIPDYLDADS